MDQQPNPLATMEQHSTFVKALRSIRNRKVSTALVVDILAELHPDIFVDIVTQIEGEKELSEVFAPSSGDDDDDQFAATMAKLKSVASGTPRKKSWELNPGQYRSYAGT